MTTRKLTLGKFKLCVFALFSTLHFRGVGTDNIESMITPALYGNGCTLFPFDLSPDRCNGKLTLDNLFTATTTTSHFRISLA